MMLMLMLMFSVLVLEGGGEEQTAAIALHDFAAREADELSFLRGEKLFIVSILAEGEEGWGVARHMDGREGLFPLNYVKLSSDPYEARQDLRSRSHLGTGLSSAGGLLTAVAAARAAATAADHEHQSDETAMALRAYRLRRALYNGPTAPLQRWGVGLDVSQPDAPSKVRSLPPTSGHRSGVHGVPFFNLIEFMDEHELALEIRAMLRDEWLPDFKVAHPPQPALPLAPPCSSSTHTSPSGV